MNIYSLSSLIGLVLNLIIGIFVFIKNPKAERNRIFALFIVVISLWIGGCFMQSIVRTQDEAQFWDKIIYTGIILSQPISLNMYMLLIRFNLKKKFLWFIYLTAICFLIINFIPSLRPYLINDVTHYYPFRYISSPGPLWFALIGFAVYLATFGILKVWQAIKASSPGLKNMYRYLLLAYILMVTAGSLYFLLVIKFYTPPIDNLLMVIFAFIMAYVIIKYRLLDIKIALTRAGIFIFVYLLVLGFPFWFSFKTGLWIVGMLFMALLASLSPFIYNYLKRKAEEQLLKEDIKRYETLKSFARSIGLVRDLDSLLKLIVYRLVKTLRLSYSAIYLFDEEENGFVLKARYRLNRSLPILPEYFSEESSFIKFILVWRKEFLSEELYSIVYDKVLKRKNNGLDNNSFNPEEVINQVHNMKAFFVMPSFSEKELVGFLILGEKLSGKSYSDKDIEVLTTLGRSASLAIMNGIYMVNLKKTQEELSEAQRIAQLGYLASATGHQINNVLNVIGVIAEGILCDDDVMEAIKDNEKAQKALEKHIGKIIENVESGGMIVREIRDYTQLEADKEFELVDIKEVIDKALKLLYISANKFQTIDIDIKVGDDIPNILGSFVSLENVFVNMLNNAYDAIVEKRHYLKGQGLLEKEGYKGRIEIEAKLNKNKVEIHIRDDGKGITEEVRRKLFTPLYTTKTSSLKREEQRLSGGTGIGLYTILLIIKKHRGSIRLFRTEYMRGSDFLIELPVPKKEEVEEIMNKRGKIDKD